MPDHQDIQDCPLGDMAIAEPGTTDLDGTPLDRVTESVCLSSQMSSSVEVNLSPRILFYACETWILPRTALGQVRRSHNVLLRRALGISWIA
jgi:hypothetical protein